MLIELPVILISALVLAYAAQLILKKVANQPRLYDGMATFLQSLMGITTPLIIGCGLILALRSINDYYQLPIKHQPDSGALSGPHSHLVFIQLEKQA